TTLGWFRALSGHEAHFLRRYLPGVDHDPVWGLIRLAWASVADYALCPLQDVLNLGTEARMNFPGKAGGNWTWRFRFDMLHDGIIGRLADLTDVYNRAR